MPKKKELKKGRNMEGSEYQNQTFILEKSRPTEEQHAP
jgi:hypothetical protein